MWYSVLVCRDTLLEGAVLASALWDVLEMRRMFSHAALLLIHVLVSYLQLYIVRLAEVPT
jgi:hypothetical protein